MTTRKKMDDTKMIPIKKSRGIGAVVVDGADVYIPDVEIARHFRIPVGAVREKMDNHGVSVPGTFKGRGVKMVSVFLSVRIVEFLEGSSKRARKTFLKGVDAIRSASVAPLKSLSTPRSPRPSRNSPSSPEVQQELDLSGSESRDGDGDEGSDGNLRMLESSVDALRDVASEMSAALSLVMESAGSVKKSIDRAIDKADAAERAAEEAAKKTSLPPLRDPETGMEVDDLPLILLFRKSRTEMTPTEAGRHLGPVSARKVIDACLRMDMGFRDPSQKGTFVASPRAEKEGLAVNETTSFTDAKGAPRSRKHGKITYLGLCRLAGVFNAEVSLGSPPDGSE